MTEEFKKSRAEENQDIKGEWVWEAIYREPARHLYRVGGNPPLMAGSRKL